MDSRKRSITSYAEDMSTLYEQWDEISCAICMDHPHNAILLVCSSHDKGCRSYVCDTSYRHSNCFDRFKKVKEENSETSLIPETPRASVNYPVPDWGPRGELDFEEITDIKFAEGGSNLKCPLCRGPVFGWKVIDEARKYLNLKSRSCSRESCSFSGNYRELRGHARRVHPTARPADVDPSRQRAWRRLEDQREYNDTLSAIQSEVPGSVVIGDYMLETGDMTTTGEWGRGVRGLDAGRWLSTLVLFQMLGGGEVRGGRSRSLQRHRRGGGSFPRRRYLWGENLLGLRGDDHDDDDDDDGDDDDDDVDEDDDDDEVDLNMLSDIGPPRRRRRLM